MVESKARATEKVRSPLVRQFSVFLENKVGTLLDITRLLGEGNIHICGLSVVDTTDASVVRMIVDDPDHCRGMLQDAHIPFKESCLVVVELPQGPEKLDQVLSHLVAAEVNIQYTYSLMIRPHDKVLLALHCEDSEYADVVLTKAGCTVLDQKDISR